MELTLLVFGGHGILDRHANLRRQPQQEIEIALEKGPFGYYVVKCKHAEGFVRGNYGYANERFRSHLLGKIETAGRELLCDLADVVYEKRPAFPETHGKDAGRIGSEVRIHRFQ